MNGGTNWGLGELGNYTLTPEHRMKVRTLKVHREVCTSTDERERHAVMQCGIECC